MHDLGTPVVYLEQSSQSESTYWNGDALQVLADGGPVQNASEQS